MIAFASSRSNGSGNSFCTFAFFTVSMGDSIEFLIRDCECERLPAGDQDVVAILGRKQRQHRVHIRGADHVDGLGRRWLDTNSPLSARSYDTRVECALSVSVARYDVRDVLERRRGRWLTPTRERPRIIGKVCGRIEYAVANLDADFFHHPQRRPAIALVPIEIEDRLYPLAAIADVESDFAARFVYAT